MKERQNIALYDNTDLMVYDHEPWLETSGSHGHAGGSVEVYLKWGRNMRADRLFCKERKEGMEALVVTPDGELERLNLTEGGPDFCILRFPAAVDGFYHVVAKNTCSNVMDIEEKSIQGTCREHPDASRFVFYIQYAQAFVPVGNSPGGIPHRARMSLEIKPILWKKWRVGDEVGLQVQFLGEPQEGVVMDLTCSGPGVYRQWREITDGNGRINLQAWDPGRYLMVARYRMPEREEKIYGALFLTATLFFFVEK